MEQDFFNKLRESMDAERDFQPDPADWETLQQRLTTIPVSSVPFYFTIKFRLAMLTTVFIAIGSFFYWSVPQSATEITTTTTSNSTLVAKEELIKKVDSGLKTPLIIDEKDLNKRQITESANETKERKTIVTQRENIASTPTNSTTVPPQLTTSNWTQITSYENTDLVMAESIITPTRTATSNHKVDERDDFYMIDNQSVRQEHVKLELLESTKFHELEMQQIEEDTFIIRQQIPEGKDKAFRWQVAAYSTWGDGLISHIPLFSSLTKENGNDGLGVGLKVGVIYKNKLRFTVHGNNHSSSYYVRVNQIFGNVTVEEYFAANGQEIAQTEVVDRNFDVNDYEYGASFEYFPLSTHRFKPYIGLGGYHLKIYQHKTEITKDENNFVRMVEQGTKTYGRTTLTPTIGIEYAFNEHFYALLQGVTFFTVRDQLKYNSGRLDIGVGYTF